MQLIYNSFLKKRLLYILLFYFVIGYIYLKILSIYNLFSYISIKLEL